MKIIGQTKDGYIVEMDEAEIANACGYGSSYDAEFKQQTSSTRSGYNSDHRIRVGTELQVAKVNTVMGRIVAGQGEVQKASDSMRALANLIDQTLAHIIPPEVLAPAAPATAEDKP